MSDNFSNETLSVLIGDIKKDTEHIKAQVEKTNGRVKKLELWRAYLTGAFVFFTMVVGWVGFQWVNLRKNVDIDDRMSKIEELIINTEIQYEEVNN